MSGHSGRKAIFFDRDNTLIYNDGYLGDPGQVRLIEGAAEAIAHLRRLGFAIITCSNQSGVARGYFDEAAVRAVNARMDQLLQQIDAAAVIDDHEYCPFHPEAVVSKYRKNSDLRKPAPGMLLRAAQRWNLDLNKSWMVGDAPRDIAAGRAAGCRTILFRPPGVQASPAARQTPVRADFQAESLLEVARIIENSLKGVDSPPETGKRRPPSQLP